VSGEVLEAGVERLLGRFRVAINALLLVGARDRDKLRERNARRRQRLMEGGEPHVGVERVASLVRQQLREVPARDLFLQLADRDPVSQRELDPKLPLGAAG
jgi:hypothetical protein